MMYVSLLKLMQDIPYLTPIVDQVQAEWAERIEMDSAIPEKKAGALSGAVRQATEKAKKVAGH
jgi:hypothetical protein